MTDILLTTHGKESVHQAAHLISQAFKADPTLTYILASLPRTERSAYLPKFLTAVLTSVAFRGAQFTSANDWESCGVLLPPGCTVGHWRTVIPAGLLGMLWSVGLSGCQRMLGDLTRNEEVVKKRHLKGEKYLYVYFLGTVEEGRGKGLCSAIVRSYQEQARREKLPLYLDAATDYCWALYKTLGFVTLEEYRIGEGKAGSDGQLCVSGEGYLLRAMIWRP